MIGAAEGGGERERESGMVESEEQCDSIREEDASTMEGGVDDDKG